MGRTSRGRRRCAGCRRESAGAPEDLFSQGAIHLSTGSIHTVKPLAVDIPKGRLTAVTGVSGSGKTTLILESLVPGLEAAIEGRGASGACEIRSGRRHPPG